MKLTIAATCLLVLLTIQGCAQKVKEDVYHKTQEMLIDEHLRIARKAGHDVAIYHISTYGWHRGLCGEKGNYSPCYFGSYTFSQEKFNAVMRGEIPPMSGTGKLPGEQLVPESLK